MLITFPTQRVTAVPYIYMYIYTIFSFTKRNENFLKKSKYTIIMLDLKNIKGIYLNYSYSYCTNLKVIESNLNGR